MISDSRVATVNVCAAQFLIGDNLICGSLHKRWASQVNSTSSLYNYSFIGHSRHIGTSSSTFSHYQGDLGNTLRGHGCLVEKDTSEMFTIWEHIILLLEIGTTRIHHVHTRQSILQGNLLSSQMLFHSDWGIGTSFCSGVICHQHALLAMNSSNSSNNTPRRQIIVIQLVTSQCRQFHECGTWINQFVNTLTSKQFATFSVQSLCFI
mmetsp:Transcript_4682/g.17607  ORF Transcript_4682/g.17607 Transcript_4682/m.17607 type:complete len:207 (-) Transcript_4682:316-936(-)